MSLIISHQKLGPVHSVCIRPSIVVKKLIEMRPFKLKQEVSSFKLLSIRYFLQFYKWSDLQISSMLPFSAKNWFVVHLICSGIAKGKFYHLTCFTQIEAASLSYYSVPEDNFLSSSCPLNLLFFCVSSLFYFPQQPIDSTFNFWFFVSITTTYLSYT